jgi:hypothetical protein
VGGARDGRAIPEGEPVDVGADFGWKHDTTAIVPLWAPDPAYMLFGVPEILTPPRDGSILVAGRSRRRFATSMSATRSAGVIDPDRAAEIAVWLEEDLGVEVVEHLQTQPADGARLRAVDGGDAQPPDAHPRDPEFTEHVLNAVAKMLPDGRAAVRPSVTSRAQAGQRRRVIDALIAAAMVLSVAIAEANAVPVVPFVEAIYG